ncbi:hypothetical protein, partial [Enterobacter roggenkampii]|uniref:hypothetical protein n=1 Tax=Enterobacter roggenkampii TaxID=1812935 RepID=UPI00388DF40F
SYLGQEITTTHDGSQENITAHGKHIDGPSYRPMKHYFSLCEFIELHDDTINALATVHREP